MDMSLSCHCCLCMCAGVFFCLCELRVSMKSAVLGCPPILCGKRLNIERYMQANQPKFFHICHAYKHHTTSCGLYLHLGSQGQQRAKPVVLIFAHTFQLIGKKFGIVLKQFKTDSTFEEILCRRGKKKNFCGLCQRSFSIFMHLNVYERVWFNLGLVIDATELFF